jgi:hypothetical protein
MTYAFSMYKSKIIIMLLLYFIFSNISFCAETQTNTPSLNKNSTSSRGILSKPEFIIPLSLGISLYSIYEGSERPRVMAVVMSLITLYSAGSSSSQIKDKSFYVVLNSYLSTMFSMITYNAFYAPENSKDEVFLNNLGVGLGGFVTGYVLSNLLIPDDEVANTSLLISGNTIALAYKF